MTLFANANPRFYTNLQLRENQCIPSIGTFTYFAHYNLIRHSKEEKLSYRIFILCEPKLACTFQLGDNHVCFVMNEFKI